MNKLISVIVSTYNEEKYIRNCLNSLLKQTYKPLEIIVVDDGSTDNTKDIVREFHQIIFIENKHQGTALSRNLAANQAKGDILVFLDSDMIFDKNFVEKLVDPILKNISKGTFSKLEYVANWDKPLARCWNRNSNPSLPDKLRVMPNLNEGEDFRAILKSEFNKVQGFDNTGYTDTWSLAKKLRFKPTNAPHAIYYHYNPETFFEIFQSAKWIGKREYKAGVLGSLFTFLKACLIFSIYNGIIRALKYKNKEYLPFQIIYDYGLKTGIIQKLFLSNNIK